MRLTTIFLFGSLLGSAACLRGNASGNIDSAESAIDSSDSVSSEGDLVAANVDGASTAGLTALTDDELALSIVANIHAKWPNACAQVTTNGAEITVVYNDCSGPRGLVHVTGTLDLTVSLDPTGAVEIHATGTGVEVNKAVLDIDADAVYTVSGSTHSLAVTSKGSGTGPRGNDIDHEGNYTLTWDPSTTCGSIAGHWQTDFTSSTATAERSNDLSLSKCVGACPSGTLTHHFLGGASVTVTFDGSATATWTASTGGSGSVALACH
ncbi:MAG: hypothetical protein ABI467_20645 [Kofleriaceae bacterium]